MTKSITWVTAGKGQGVWTRSVSASPSHKRNKQENFVKISKIFKEWIREVDEEA